MHDIRNILKVRDDQVVHKYPTRAWVNYSNPFAKSKPFRSLQEQEYLLQQLV